MVLAVGARLPSEGPTVRGGGSTSRTSSGISAKQTLEHRCLYTYAKLDGGKLPLTCRGEADAQGPLSTVLRHEILIDIGDGRGKLYGM